MLNYVDLLGDKVLIYFFSLIRDSNPSYHSELSNYVKSSHRCHKNNFF